MPTEQHGRSAEEKAKCKQKLPLSRLEVVSYGKEVLVRGHTGQISNTLKELGGSWQPKLQGWLYPGTKHTNIVDRLRANGHAIDDQFQKLENTASEPTQSQPSYCRQNNTKKRTLEDEDTNVMDDRNVMFWTT